MNTSPDTDSPPACTQPPGIAARDALLRLLDDTLTCLGTLDVTDRDGLFASLNLVERLLAVLGNPPQALRDLTHRLRTEGATARAALAAALYRELATLAGEPAQEPVAPLSQRADGSCAAFV